MISLQRYPLIKHLVDGQTMWLLEIHASSTLGINSSKIFVYHASMNDDKFEGDVFEAVTSVHQVAVIPEDTSIDFDALRVIPYYRSNVLKHFVNDPVEAELLWNDIKEDVQELSEQLSGLDLFFEIGGPGR